MTNLAKPKLRRRLDGPDWRVVKGTKIKILYCVFVPRCFKERRKRIYDVPHRI